jgi:argininosuccinate lyase
MMKATVWNKRFPGRADEPAFERMNVSIGADAFLAGAEVRASAAYAAGLAKAGAITPAEARSIAKGLKTVGERIAAGEDLGRFEDVHTAVEMLLVETIGEAGKKLHTGRSRNEQVAADERLYLMEEVPALRGRVAAVQRGLLRLAERWGHVLMPGYTHLQRAQALLFGQYILSFFWALERDKERLSDALKRISVLPLGSGALAGSTVPLDRDDLAERLGFSAVSPNSLDAVGDRSFILETIAALSLLALDLSRLGEDLVVFSSAEFGFFDLDDSLATSSSLMPQKKNPDIFELMRAWPGRLFGHYSRLFVVLKGLPSSYSKDLQEDKAPLRECVEDAAIVLDAAAAAVRRIKPNAKRMRAALAAGMFATDLVDHLVAKGMSFREAHGVVGMAVALAERKRKGLDELTEKELESIAPELRGDISAVFDPFGSVCRKRTAGSTHPDEVKSQIAAARRLF